MGLIDLLLGLAPDSGPATVFVSLEAPESVVLSWVQVLNHERRVCGQEELYLFCVSEPPNLVHKLPQGTGMKAEFRLLCQDH